MKMLEQAQSMERLKMFAIGFVVIGVTVTVGLNITSDVKSNIVLDRTVDNETFNGTTDPQTVTVDEASDNVFVELTSVTVYNTTSQDTEIGTVEIVDGSAGKFNISNYNSGDNTLESYDYRYEDEDTDARQGATDAIDGLTELSGFLPIIGLVVAAAVVIGLVSSGFGSSSGRRGRA